MRCFRDHIPVDLFLSCNSFLFFLPFSLLVIVVGFILLCPLCHPLPAVSVPICRRRMQMIFEPLWSGGRRLLYCPILLRSRLAILNSMLLLVGLVFPPPAVLVDFSWLIPGLFFFQVSLLRPRLGFCVGWVCIRSGFSLRGSVSFPPSVFPLPRLVLPYFTPYPYLPHGLSR